MCDCFHRKYIHTIIKVLEFQGIISLSDFIVLKDQLTIGHFKFSLKVYTMERIEHIDSKECKGQKTITIHLKGGNEPRLMLSPQVRLNLISYKICLYCLHRMFFFYIYMSVTVHVNLLIVYIINIVLACALFFFPSSFLFIVMFKSFHRMKYHGLNGKKHYMIHLLHHNNI
jgi:hypothetical protein